MAQFRQPDFSRGDPNTLGGYMAAHDRPAAFEGSDGFSYSVEILADDSGDAGERWGAYLFFVRWARIGASAPEGHLESDILHRGHTEDEARDRVGAMRLNDVKRVLDALIAQSPAGPPRRKWWDAMHAATDEDESSP
jgi:hypothetical protein